MIFVSYQDQIKPDNKGLITCLNDLLTNKYQIQSYKRCLVWNAEIVKKLWNSIYKFYPLDSILIWKTDLKLQNHRSIGRHLITDADLNLAKYQYLLDGQQRTNFLFTSLYGGNIKGRNDFDPAALTKFRRAKIL
jgi:uncharacterized protein with ParB-like and HNH nuclease domain